jgi:tRNA(Ser,Leu) C12 N-acetylase TAN1
MRDWNLILTVIPGPRHERTVLNQIGRLGRFAHSPFKDVCIGRVDDVPQFLEDVHAAQASGERWATMIARVVPLERHFTFTPRALTGLPKDALAPLVDRMHGGTFYFRLERRGLAGEIATREIERDVADHLFSIAQAQGKRLDTHFADPDYVVVAETLGEQCGVALITRELSQRYPFIQAR